MKLPTRRTAVLLCVAAGGLLLAAAGCGRRLTTADGKPIVRVGSKSFPENVILGEMARDLAAASGAEAEHAAWLGDTGKPWNALLSGDIDAYAEYTGTLRQELLADEGLQSDDELRTALEAKGLRMSRSVGFSDTYAIAMKRDRAAALGIKTISDLKTRPKLNVGVSTAFRERGDGWSGLKVRYGLPFDPQGLDHTVVYQALKEGTLDVADVYSTEPQIRQFDLQVLEDDKHYFPAYDAVLLYRADLEARAPRAVRSMLRLEGAISEDAMRDLNARAQTGEKTQEAQIAADFLAEKFDVHVAAAAEGLWQRLLTATLQHLFLVAVSLALGILTAVPLGVLAAKQPSVGQLVLGAAGVVQSFPALALLVLLLAFPFYLPLGAAPAIVALFLYSLLPIMRNTYTGLHDIPLTVRESAEALGLSSFARLRLIELPMASRSILAGIKTAAVIAVGNATLGGLIGAGGYGLAILIGLNKNDPHLLWEGALPAVAMALAVQGLFELAERFLVPRGLRLQAAR
jgi:osmoprotectant transport system permease protein